MKYNREMIIKKYNSKENIENPTIWKGENLLGFALMEVRDMLAQRFRNSIPEGEQLEQKKGEDYPELPKNSGNMKMEVTLQMKFTNKT